MFTKNYIFDVIIIIVIIIIIIFIINNVFVVVILQNRQVMATFFLAVVGIVGAPTRASIVGVPAVSGGRWVQGEWGVIVVSLWNMYVKMPYKI